MRNVLLTYGKTKKRFRVPAIEAWEIVANEVSELLKPGDVVGLSGPLGAGKTTFTQTLAKTLGVKKFLPSPTFALLRTYRISGHASIKRLLHVDAYRIENERDLLALNLDEELSEPGTILIIEWPEHVSHWFTEHASIELRIETKS